MVCDLRVDVLDTRSLCGGMVRDMKGTASLSLLSVPWLWPTPDHMHQSFDHAYHRQRQRPVERSADEIRAIINKRKKRKLVKSKRKQNRGSK